MKGIYHLRGTVKNYDWGGFSFLPALLNTENPGKTPFAEYWIGTHSGGSSKIIGDDGNPLPLEGMAGQFPYLLKILDVRDMLSIQVHPDKAGAAADFERENREGISNDDPERNYHDPNEKPELMVALSEFWLLHGFKPTEELHDILLNVTELNELLPIFRDKGYEGLYKAVMEMPQQDVNRLLQPLASNILPKYDNNELTKETEDFWAARALKKFTRGHDIDRGIFSIYFFNLLHLDKGEGIYQPPGIPHAYLEGRNVEIMGNSDNVLRGGLTNKHIAIGELLKHIRFEPTWPLVLTPVQLGEEMVYETPSSAFRLSVIELSTFEKKGWQSARDEVLLLAEGEAVIRNRTSELKLSPGCPSILVMKGQDVQVTARKSSVIYKAQSGLNIHKP